MEKIRTRFAPSPTGSMHIGNLRTALFAYALAKKNKGDFLLRIEDTDKKREVEGGVEEIKDLLQIFNLKWDEFYIQSERVKEGIYKKYADELVKNGNAFYCQCDAKNAKKEGFSKELRDPCREKELNSGAIKLKVPEGKISFKDFVLNKEIEWDLSTISDTTLLKSDGFPTYHLAAAVDDHLMKINHVLRGHDWMPSTPIHLLVYKFLDFTVPKIGHLTDILDPEGGKLSKRKGSTSCEGLLNEGYLPEALLNFIML
ncbi:MAG: glutamate--tRNA ligase family protein, partial [Patescibacteria group bacterium]